MKLRMPIDLTLLIKPFCGWCRPFYHHYPSTGDEWSRYDFGVGPFALWLSLRGPF